MRVPAEILAQPGPLTDDQRRLVERHPSVGAHMISRIMPGGGIFVEGATDHHERLDGTGYPAGRRDLQLSPYTRILAICDIYAALAARRPYRPAQDTRTALTDTLLLADQGTLDRTQAEKLLGLSFYPVGSVVELNDGAAGYVMATLPGRQGVDNPGKPIVSLFTGPGGQMLAVPRLVHLLADGRSIVAQPSHERAPEIAAGKISGVHLMSQAGGDYWSRPRHPWSCVLFVLPLLAIYEVGLHFLGPTPVAALRNGADVWLRSAPGLRGHFSRLRCSGAFGSYSSGVDIILS